MSRTSLLRRLDKIDDRRRALLDRLAQLPHETLEFAPRPGKWSCLEQVEHLVRVEPIVMGDLTPEQATRPRERP